MLVSLEIRNFLLIKKLSINLIKGFNTFTGETGAGKSIIIDALKLGYIVIAPDLPPFNEYIDHSKNGFLYDLNDPKPIQLEDFNLEMISKTAFESVKKGREDFKASLPAIHDYIFNDENFTYPTNYFENLEKVFEDSWYRFGILANKDKIKIFFRFIFSKVKNRF